MPTETPRLLIINGPNLNLLGTREPGIYGSSTLADIEALCRESAAALGFEAELLQSNHEGTLIDAIQAARQNASGIVINPAAYTHTSVAIADALRAVNLPVVEVHLSNVHAREEFRRHSYVSPAAAAVIAGAGLNGYRYAIDHLATLLRED
ncbi:type II 3-dehydroquinate dehydratase [Nesterenkonia sp. E16_7]|uniref:type II 3-dehydroquinate dehydratase n=1 Tax=unclassified Nesterenkonia TaxID=2629769 RepID=UPI001A92A7EB|nr:MULTISPECIES: type II 3-dehydroquinate dehydratase [unclassified Nesterenkonia]MBO0597002.1 type II 3-dehydroquinate dehydratase [Nesterenkonia sp. E16_10]MBO0599891.1 type II 3-dehydroquinate dehydratase [Nesterenkonia sp. E16_7]